MSEISGGRAAAHARTALVLSLFTVAYNLGEGIASILFAVRDDSAALLGFGSDSFVESLSGAVMVWRFLHPHGALEREQRATRHPPGSIHGGPISNPARSMPLHVPG